MAERLKAAVCFRRGNHLARAPVFSNSRRLHGRRAQGRRQGSRSHGVAESTGNRRIDAANRDRASTSQRVAGTVASSNRCDIAPTMTSQRSCNYCNRSGSPILLVLFVLTSSRSLSATYNALISAGNPDLQAIVHPECITPRPLLTQCHGFADRCIGLGINWDKTENAAPNFSF
jgi:hypothetical protein